MGEAVEHQQLLASLRSTVFKESETLGESFVKIEGYDFNRGVDYSQLLKSMVSTGFQASNLGDAIEVVNLMLDWRLADEAPTEDCSEEESDPSYRESVRCKVFLGFTSNLISSGVRETVRYLVEHHMARCVVPWFKGNDMLPLILNSSRPLAFPDARFAGYCFHPWGLVPIQMGWGHAGS